MASRWLDHLPSPIKKHIEGQEYLQNVISNAGWLFGNKILGMTLGLLVGVWLARYLGPEQFGLYSYAFAYVTLFMPIALLGLDDIVIRNIVRDPTCRDETLGSCFALKLLAGFLLFVCLISSIALLRPDNDAAQRMIWIMAIGSVFQAFTTVEHWFYSQVQSKYIVWAQSGSFIVCSVVRIVFIVIGAPLYIFAWVVVAESCIASCGVLALYLTTGNKIATWQIKYSRCRELLRESWPLMFSSMMMMLYMRIDQVMLGNMVSSKEVGVYSVAVRLAEVWLAIPAVIFSSVFPSIIEARRMGDDIYYSRLQKLYNVMVLVNYTVAIPVTLLASLVVNILYGAEYVAAGPMLAVLVWANLFSSLELARSSFLTTMSWTKLNFITLLLGAIANIILNYFLIPLYGGMGSAIASCISYWLAAHGTCFLFKPLHRTGNMLTKALAYPKVW